MLQLYLMFTYIYQGGKALLYSNAVNRGLPNALRMAYPELAFLERTM